MTVMETILEELAKVTLADVAQTMLTLGPIEDDETALGVVASTHTRCLWALANHYLRDSQMYAHSCKFDAKTREEQLALAKLHSKAHVLEEIVRDLAWAEIRAELNEWDNETIGLREGFTLVSTTAVSAVGGILPLPDEVLRALIRKVVEARTGITTEEPKPKTRKPQ